ncbi:MAG: hypothetical protein EAZ11_11385 [Curvibacter sp.]|nr:MAG: hypothetical protein EAZ11_11385 [Curvibacter sp.]
MTTDRLQPATLRHPAIARVVVARMGVHPVGRNWTQLLMLTLVLWIALFYSGIGNVIGAPPDVVANRIEARMLAQLRHSGTSQASRWARAEPGAEMTTWAAVSSLPVLSPEPFAAALHLPSFGLQPSERQAERPVFAGLPSRAAPRWQTPLTRAPPFQVFQA